MPVITFLPSHRKVEVEKGTTILEAAQKANLNMNVVCGGQGKCGKCVVYRKNGEAEFDQEKYRMFFTPEELCRGASLACRTHALGDLSIEIPDSTLIQEQKILEESMGVEVVVLPSVTKYYAEMTPPTLEDPSPDLTRLLWRIEKQGGPPVRKIFAPLPILKELSRTLRENEWKVTATVAIVPGGYRLIHIEGGDTRSRLYGAAVDLGTTTIVVTVRSLVDGTIMGVASNYNRQISAGEDILSRVNFARKTGLSRLQRLAAESINIALHSACEAANIDSDDIFELEIAGNTVMTHLLLEIDPEYMIAEPYVPVVRRSIYTTA
ncbi:MAG: 2Fe-2S iron-sulfur cluster-binding protein, partial [Methanomicrobiales archaeon]|nr:2Fe-2S iron-sulfur cluster-binding protein [Methanomicrobiales archaeon]